VGIGLVKPVFIAFAAEQIEDDEEDVSKREAKASYFSSYYAVANIAMLTAGTVLVWLQDKVSWGLGYGICGSFVAVAVIVLAATAPMYRTLPPVGSPSKGIIQVLFAFSRKLNLTVPDDATELYEEHGVKNPVRQRLQHTDQFR
jgi:peptide/histidine transporter 3/4